MKILHFHDLHPLLMVHSVKIISHGIESGWLLLLPSKVPMLCEEAGGEVGSTGMVTTPIPGMEKEEFSGSKT